MNTSIKELQTMTSREAKYRMYERLEDYHSTGCNMNGVIVGEQRFDLALADKWGMLAYADGNSFLGGF